MTLYRGFQGGPADFLPVLVKNCRDTWWLHLLYITNFEYKPEYFDTTVIVSFKVNKYLKHFNNINFKKLKSNFFQCLGQTWYLDNDMQMFLVAPLIIYPLWRLKKWGLFMSCNKST
jgi:peptidoglycan/LPS O-acetylase OafA/YrhL